MKAVVSDDAVLRSKGWPTTVSRLDTTPAGIMLAMGILFALAGWMPIILYAADVGTVRGWVTRDDANLLAILFGGIGGLGTVTVLGIALSYFRDRSIQHAADDVLPDVPREPVTEALPPTDMPHQWIEGIDGVSRLRPNRDRLRRLKKRILYWMVVVGPMGPVLVWWTPPNTLIDVVFVGLFSVGWLFAGYWVYKLVIRILRDLESGMRELQVDRNAGVCRFLNNGEQVEILLEEVVAIQLCYYEESSSPGSRKTLQLNLVLRVDGGGDGDSEAYQRRTLVITGYDCPSLARELAEPLARSFGVPLLVHATKADQQAEHARAKQRKRSRTASSRVPDFSKVVDVLWD